MNTNNTPITIAIADDNQVFRIGLSRLVQTFPNCNVALEEEDCDDLLRKISSMPVQPQLCIVDMAMPGGYQMLKEAKNRFPDMKIMVLSMTTNELSLIRTIKIGVNGFLLKTCDRTELQNAIYAISNSGSYFPDGGKQEIEATTKDSMLLQLSYEELEILSLCSTEMPVKSIADNLRISLRTMEKHLQNLYNKLGVKSRVGLVLFALKNMGLKPAIAKQG